MFAICKSSRIFSQRAFSSGLRFFLTICFSSCVLLLFYTSQEVYTNYRTVSIYSLVETAGANGLSERGYLHIVLSNLPSMDFRQHPELLKDLMPWSDYMRSCFEQE